MRISAPWLVGMGLVALVLGCKKSNTDAQLTPGQAPFEVKGGGAGGGGAAIDESSPFAAGMKVYQAKGCARCHSGGVGGAGGGGPMAGGFGPPGGPPGGGQGGPPGGGQGFQGGPPPGGGGPPGGPGGGPGGPGGGRGGMRRGPDLAKVGTKHDAKWLMDHVRNPKSHKPESNMPAFDQSKLTDADLKSLGDYLASLK